MKADAPLGWKTSARNLLSHFSHIDSKGAAGAMVAWYWRRSPAATSKALIFLSTCWCSSKHLVAASRLTSPKRMSVFRLRSWASSNTITEYWFSSSSSRHCLRSVPSAGRYSGKTARSLLWFSPDLERTTEWQLVHNIWFVGSSFHLLQCGFNGNFSSLLLLIFALARLQQGCVAKNANCSTMEWMLSCTLPDVDLSDPMPG